MNRKQFWTVVGTLLGVGGFLALVDLPLPGSELYKSIGHAFVVAALLASTVDLYFKKVFFKEGLDDISKFLLGYELPKEIQNRIRTLMSMQLVRRNYHIIITFPSQISGASMPVKVQQAFDLDNITESSMWYRHSHVFDQSDTISELEILSCSDGDTVHYTGTNVPQESNTAGNTGKTIVTWPLTKIPAQNGSKNKIYSYELRFLMKEKHALDGHNFNFHIPTINLTIDVKSPEALKIVVLVPDPDVAFSNHWEYKRLFTTGESIRVQWELESADPAADANKARAISSGATH
jgi:hypothetical protein